MTDLTEVDPGLRAEAAIDEITLSRKQWAREHRRAKALTPREALIALEFEALFVWTCAANLRAGLELCDDDFERLSLACRRFHAICDEAAR